MGRSQPVAGARSRTRRRVASESARVAKITVCAVSRKTPRPIVSDVGRGIMEGSTGDCARATAATARSVQATSRIMRRTYLLARPTLQYETKYRVIPMQLLVIRHAAAEDKEEWARTGK